MNMPNFKLSSMIGEDFETCRAAGYSYRREMTHAVMWGTECACKLGC